MKLNQKFTLLILLALAIFLVNGCDKKNSTEPDHADEVEVTLAYTPNPATVNTAISFTFEVEDHGEHVAVSGFASEVEKAGTGNHKEMNLQAEQGETGHYSGTYTFTEAGTYEIHFEFMYEDDMHEEQFSIQVQ